MDKRAGQSGEFEKPNWDWTQVECALKTIEGGRKSAHWQLAPSILLTNPNSVTSDPVVRLFIDTEKSLSYSQDLGWNWHKSWNLPNISIRLEIKDDITGEQLLSPKNIYAQLFAVKKNGDSDRSDKLTLLDVGIRGESKMEMIDGQVYFSAMKFSSTTYNNEGQNFHLLIVIYIQENQTDKPKVLTAVLSPQIFVDSRRSARDYQEKKFNSFVEPFSPDQLDKEFIKRENKTRMEQEIQIKNDSEGFYNYLTAPNIRHKVKHPLFLTIRFSNCASIFYNSQKIPKPSEEVQVNVYGKELLETLQRKLLKESQSKNVRQEFNIPNSERLYLFCVRNVNDSLKRKKVMESIETLESQSIGIVYGEDEIPEEFENMANLGPLNKIYRENYESLKEICRRYIPSEAESSEYDSDEEYGESPKKARVKLMENSNGFAYGNNQNIKRAKTANIVCQTIPTIDKYYGNKEQDGRKAQSNHQNNQIIEGSSEQGIKEEEPERREIVYPAPENNVSQIRNNINISNGNPPNNKVSLNIISKKTAFSNPKADEKPRNEERQSQEYNSANPNPNLNEYTNNITHNQKLRNQPGVQNNQMQGLGQLMQGLGQGLSLGQGIGGQGMGNQGMGGLGLGQGMGGQGMGNQGMGGQGMGNQNMGNQGMGGFGSNGLQGLNSYGNQGGLNGLMGGMGGLGGMNGLNGLGGLNGLSGLGGFGGVNGLNGLGGLGGMGGLGNLNNLGGLGGLGGLSGLSGLGGLGGFQGQGQGQGNFNFTNPPQGSQGQGGQGGQGQTGQTGQTGQGQSKSLENLLCSNMVLSNWLNSVKNNNVSLYQSMKGGNSSQGDQNRSSNQFKNVNQSLADMNRLSPQLQEQQSMLCLLQQINLYRELLTQVTYQNQLLGRNLNSGQMMPDGRMNDEIPQNPQLGRNSYDRNNFGSQNSESRDPKEEQK